MKTTTTLSVLFALLLAFGLAPQDAQAQAQFEIGPRVGYEVDDLEEFSIGADVRASTAAFPFQVNGTFDYFLLDNDNVSLYQLTLNGLFEIGFENEIFTPYFGPGLSLTRFSVDDGDFLGFDSSESELGLNLVGGAEFGLGNLRPFVQAQFTVGGDIQPASVVAGLLFRIGQ